MLSTKKIAMYCARIFTCFGLIKVASLFKMSYILGSYTAMFSGTNIVTPLVGAFAGVGGSLGVFGVGYLLRLLLRGAFSFRILAFHLPGLCASLYWSTPNAFVRLVLPIICMVAFISHPVGGSAWLYSMYWLIPIALYFVQNKSMFQTALASTFVAHAVGSVIWLYTVPMTAVAWMALIPVVAVERLVFASGMVVVHSGISYLKKQVPVWLYSVRGKLAN